MANENKSMNPLDINKDGKVDLQDAMAAAKKVGIDDIKDVTELAKKAGINSVSDVANLAKNANLADIAKNLTGKKEN